MEPGRPERIGFVYSVRHFDPIRKKRFTSRWKMEEKEAAKHFAGKEYEILWHTKEERRIGGDSLRNSMARFNTGRKK